MVKRFLLSIFVFLMFFGSSAQSAEIDELINASDLSKKSIISVSMRDIDTGEVIYEKDSSLLLHPASVLKLFTSAAVFDYLGADYKFETAFYKHGKDFYLKLSGDPMMDEKTLANLVSQLRLKEIKSLNNLYIDDTAIDNESWGEGWMYDDNTSPFFPPFNSYNINHNLIAVKILPVKDSSPKVQVIPSTPVRIDNKLKNSSLTRVKVHRNLFESPNDIKLSGEVSKKVMMFIPVVKPSVYFESRLLSNLSRYEITVSPKIERKALPSRAKKVASVSHSLGEIIQDVNKRSDNLAAEVILKHAGAKLSRSKGSTKDGLAVFKKFYDKRKANTSNIVVVDGSGASHNDLISVDWMTKALVSLSKEREFSDFKKTLAQPLETGTLYKRFSELQDKLYAKTGSLAGISSITGYIKTENDKNIAFAIMIQNFKGSSKQAKSLEDEIIKRIYKK